MASYTAIFLGYMYALALLACVWGPRHEQIKSSASHIYSIAIGDDPFDKGPEALVNNGIVALNFASSVIQVPSRASFAAQPLPEFVLTDDRNFSVVMATSRLTHVATIVASTVALGVYYHESTQTMIKTKLKVFIDTQIEIVNPQTRHKTLALRTHLCNLALNWIQNAVHSHALSPGIRSLLSLIMSTRRVIYDDDAENAKALLVHRYLEKVVLIAGATTGYAAFMLFVIKKFKPNTTGGLRLMDLLPVFFPTVAPFALLLGKYVWKLARVILGLGVDMKLRFSNISSSPREKAVAMPASSGNAAVDNNDGAALPAEVIDAKAATKEINMSETTAQNDDPQAIETASWFQGKYLGVAILAAVLLFSTLGFCFRLGKKSGSRHAAPQI